MRVRRRVFRHVVINERRDAVARVGCACQRAAEIVRVRRASAIEVEVDRDPRLIAVARPPRAERAFALGFIASRRAVRHAILTLTERRAVRGMQTDAGERRRIAERWHARAASRIRAPTILVVPGACRALELDLANLLEPARRIGTSFEIAAHDDVAVAVAGRLRAARPGRDLFNRDDVIEAMLAERVAVKRIPAAAALRPGAVSVSEARHADLPGRLASWRGTAERVSRRA